VTVGVTVVGDRVGDTVVGDLVVGDAVGERVVGDRVVGDNVGDCVVGDAEVDWINPPPAKTVLGTVSVISAVSSSTVAEMEVPAGEFGVIWIVPTSTSPEVVPAGNRPLITMRPEEIMQVKLVWESALPAIQPPKLRSPAYSSVTV